MPKTIDVLKCQECGATYEPHYHCGEPMQVSDDGSKLVCVNGDYERPMVEHHGKPMVAE
jgi:primosomal protein N'